jgi:hypothetical protein
MSTLTLEPAPPNDVTGLLLARGTGLGRELAR